MSQQKNQKAASQKRQEIVWQKRIITSNCEIDRKAYSVELKWWQKNKIAKVPQSANFPWKIDQN